MNSSRPVTELIQERFSCRSYTGETLAPELKAEVESMLAREQAGPFGNRIRFALAAAEPGDTEALKGLGTYGFIRGASAFIIGAVTQGELNFEDYGYLMEKNILKATGWDLGTCWLGGSFNRSRFAEKVGCTDDECVPAVAALGYKAGKRRIFDSTARLIIGANRRKEFGHMFFDRDFGRPLSPEQCGPYEKPLSMVRLGPSGSNKQPWRIVRDQDPQVFHLYLERSKNYYENNKRFFGMMDIQRLDMGIAMCHFEMACREESLGGRWTIDEPRGLNLPLRTQYVASWVPA